MTQELDPRAAAHRIRAHARAHFPGQFVQGSIDADRGEVTVFWYGEPPQDIRDMAAQSAIKLVRVPYSRDALLNEASRIATEHPQVASAGPSADYRSLNVCVDETMMARGMAEISSEIPVNILPADGRFVPLPGRTSLAPLNAFPE